MSDSITPTVLATALASVLCSCGHRHEALVQVKAQVQAQAAPFLSAMQMAPLHPGLSMEARLRHYLLGLQMCRVEGYAHAVASAETLLYATALIGRMVDRGVPILPLTLFGLLCGALVVAAKSHVDEPLRLSDYAALLSVATADLVAAEAFILRTLDFDVLVSLEEHRAIRHRLTAVYHALALALAPRPGPGPDFDPAATHSVHAHS